MPSPDFCFNCGGTEFTVVSLVMEGSSKGPKLPARIKYKCDKCGQPILELKDRKEVPFVTEP